MRNILLDDVLTPIGAFDLLPKKQSFLARMLKPLFGKTAPMKPVYARVAVAKYEW